MTYRIHPAIKRRAPFEAALNKGHRVGLIDSTGALIMSAREERAIRLFITFRPDLKLINIEAYLDSLK